MADGNQSGGKENESSFNSMWRLGAVGDPRPYPVFGSADHIAQKIIKEDKPRNLLINPDEDPRNREMETAYLNERLEYNHKFAKQDRDGWRLSHALTPKEVAPVLNALRRFERWDFREGVNTYQFQNLIGVALSNHESYSMTYSQLLEEGVVTGPIDEKGFVEPEYLTEIGLAHVVKIYKKVEEKPRKQRRESYEVDPDGNRKLIKAFEDVTYMEVEVEKPCFLPENERFVLALANIELAQQLITGQKQHVETEVFDAQRAALEEQVKIFFFKGIGMSNDQFKWFFNAKDIAKISSENKEGAEIGKERNRAMRIQRLIGHCETKEKMEDYLNKSFALEKILDEPMVDRMLERIGEVERGFEDGGTTPESDSKYFDRKFEKVAKYLIGEGLTITKVKRKTREGNEVEVKQYELKGWLTAAERDVCTDEWQNEAHKKSGKKGGDAVKFETKELKVRGFWTSDGNTFTRGEKDLQFAMNAKISISIEDPKGYVVRDADQMMWTRGEKDEMGAEIYAFKYAADGKTPLLDEYGKMIPNLPTGEELVEAWNRILNEEQWIKEMKPILKRFSLPGEPIGSDLSKLIHFYLYSLKDNLNERPSGLLLGVDKMKKMSQSMLSLGRTQIETAYLDKDGNVVKDESGKIKKIKSNRSLLEQWDGFKGDDYLAVEPAIDLSDMSWNKVRSPEEVEDVKVSELRVAMNTDDGKRMTVAIWESLKISTEAKSELITKHGDEAQALTAVLGEFFAMDDGGMGDNLDGFYKLMNFLAGDGNPDKRPHAYFKNTKIDPKALKELDTWTGKKKFLQIIFGAAGAWGDFRKYDRTMSKLISEGKDKKADGSQITVRSIITDEVNENVSKVQEGYYDTLRSHPDWPMWRNQSFTYEVIDENGRAHDDSMNLEQILEGTGPEQPGLASRLGFFDAKNRGKGIKHRMKTLYY